MIINYYLINLDDNPERLESAKNQLAAQNIDFFRVSAFDGRSLDVSKYHSYESPKARAYMGRDLVGGEIGCYLSHVRCAEAFLASNADYAVIFEDDLRITSDLKSVIEESLLWLAENHTHTWHLINIGNEKLKLSRRLKSFGEGNSFHKLHQAFYFPMTTTGLIWNREGAQKFLIESSRIFAPVDNFLRFWLTRTGTGLAFSPPLVRTTGAESTIDVSKTKKTRKNETKVFLHRLIKQRRLISEKIIAIKHLIHFYRKS